MPTLRGWAVTGAGFALILLWILLGDGELLMSGAFFVLAALAAIVFVRTRPLDLRLSRALSPSRVHEGDSVAVTVSFSSAGTRTVTNLRLVDEVVGLGAAMFDVARLVPGQSATGTYRVICRPRGVYPVGHASVTAADPLGLAELSASSGLVDRLVVYPRIESLTGLPPTPGLDPDQTTSKPDHAAHGGDDFYALREYQTGDDLRRVHWPWSAKTGDLMIRQLETPWRPRALVILDTRRQVYESAEAFETAVSGAASVVAHLVGNGFQTDLWDGSPFVVDAVEYHGAMERLAVTRLDAGRDIVAGASSLRTRGGGGALVLVTGVADLSLLAVQRLFSADYPKSLLLASADTAPRAIADFHRNGVETILTSPAGTWAEGWSSKMRESWNVASR